MTWIQTVSGRKFPLVELDPEQIDIEDINHALSMLCLFIWLFPVRWQVGVDGRSPTRSHDAL